MPEPLQEAVSTRILGLDTGLPSWAAVPIFAVLWAGVTALVWIVLGRVLRRWEERPGGGRFVETLLGYLRTPLSALLALAGGKFLADSNAFDPVLRSYADLALATALAAVVIWAAIRTVGAAWDRLVESRPHFAPLGSTVRYTSRALIVTTGVLVWMHAVGIPIATLLTIAGLAGLTLGLALQDTLQNFFAGLYIVLERPIRIGDYVAIEGGFEGTVVDIGWRSVRIRTPDNRLVVIANRRLSERTIVNASLPQKWVASSFSLRLPAGADLDGMATAIVEEVRAAQADVPALRADPPPRIATRLDGAGVEMTVHFAVAEPKDVEDVREVLTRRVYDRLRSSGALRI